MQGRYWTVLEVDTGYHIAMGENSARLSLC